MKQKLIHIVLNDFINDSRVLKECKVAIDLGLEVHVFALHGKNTKREEIKDGINIHRISLFSKKFPNNKAMQVIKYIEFYNKVIKKVEKMDNVVLIHSNDLGPLPIATSLKNRLQNIKIIYDAHEYETEANGVYGLRKKVTKFLEKRYIYNCDKVITVSKSIAKEYVRLYSIKEPNVILNAPKLLEFNNEKYNYFREKFNLGEETIIFLYQGALINGRGIDMIIDVFNNQHSNKHVVFMGKGSRAQEVEKAAFENSNIHYLEAVSPDKLLNYTMSADVGLCIIEPICKSYELCLPNKFFEYNMARIPVIINNLVEIQPIIKKYNSGFIIKDSIDLEKLINNITQENIENKKNNTKYIREQYNWNIEANKMREIYMQLLEV